MVVALLLKHEMHMRRPPWMPMHFFQQCTYRPIMRNRIGHRHNRLEPEISLRIAVHNTSSVWPLVVGMLHVIVARRISFPDVDLAAFDGLAGRVLERAEHEAGLASRVGGDGRARWEVLGFVRMEGA
jgi:hypothetical protein